MVTLRPYQVRAIEQLREYLRAGKRRVLLVAPTGAGKTILLAEIIRSYRERSRQPAIAIVHRRELADQTVRKLADVGVKAGIIMGSTAPTASDVQVCSIQTLQRRLDRLPPAGLVIYDEAHHASAAGAREVLSRYADAIVLGCTASPWRADKLGLADIFEAHVVAATVRELVALGSLVRADCYAYDAPDLHEVPLSCGDFNQKELGAACNTSVLVGAIVSEYVAHAAGKSAICFPVNCAHSKSIVAEFATAGVSAAHIDWSTPSGERADTLDRFRRGELRVLSSVGVLTEGFDAPVAEVCLLARPTKSLGLFIQMVGRVLRPAPGKESALVHDHAGNLFRHGFPDDERDYSPLATPKRIVEVMSCTDCGYLAQRWTAEGLCPKCGSTQHLPAEVRETSERRKGKEIVKGERLSREQIEEVRARFADREQEIRPADIKRVLAATREEKAAEYLRLQQVAARKGFKRGWAAHQYRTIWGVWPQFRQGELERVPPAIYPFVPYKRRADGAPWNDVLNRIGARTGEGRSDVLPGMQANESGGDRAAQEDTSSNQASAGH